jgi:D-glycero-D-manno-heptose 1,7-bisphosphate phosphatase
MYKAVFFDRDGVLISAPKVNNKPCSIKNFSQIKIVKGLIPYIKKIKKNFKIIMITNQPDVYRNKIKKLEVEKVNFYLKKKLKLDDVFVCYHDNLHNCNCRKPKSGLLLSAKKKWNLDLKKSFLVGDRYSDIIAGKNVGCTNFFVNHKYNERKPEKKYCYYVKSTIQAINKIQSFYLKLN